MSGRSSPRGFDMMRLSQAERVRMFDLAFPSTISREGSSTLFIHNGRICGLWDIGALYMRNYYKNPQGYYGAFPHKFKERVFALFPECRKVMHLFSGTIRPSKTKQREEITFDMKPDFRPTICDDVRNIEEYASVIRKQDLILADPMYEKRDFEKHGQKPFDKWGTIRRLAPMMKTGAFLGWLDVYVPMFSNESWTRIVSIGVEVSTNTRMRVFTVLRKKSGQDERREK
ncbi:MAG: hypothetical protein ACRECH_13690 [Nitrososphaerales archaeon]